MRNLSLSTDFHRRNEKIIINTKQSVASLAQVSCSPVSRKEDVINRTKTANASNTIIILFKQFRKEISRWPKLLYCYWAGVYDDKDKMDKTRNNTVTSANKR